MGGRSSRTADSGGITNHWGQSVARQALPAWCRVRGYVGNVPPDIYGQIRQMLPGSCPLAYTGIMNSAVSSAVGVAVLADPPPDVTTASTYEFLFFAVDGTGDGDVVPVPVVRLAFGPRTTCARVGDNELNISAHGLSEGASCYLFKLLSIEDADAFQRDITVRLRVMSLAFKSYKGHNQAQELWTQLQLTKRQTVCAIMLRVLWRVLAVCAVLVLCYTLYLMTIDQSGQPITDVALEALQTAMEDFVVKVSSARRGSIETVCAVGCGLSASDAQHCLNKDKQQMFDGGPYSRNFAEHRDNQLRPSSELYTDLPPRSDLGALHEDAPYGW